MLIIVKMIKWKPTDIAIISNNTQENQDASYNEDSIIE